MKTTMKSMKVAKAKTAMKGRVMKKKVVSKIARGKLAKVVVFKGIGNKEKTASGQSRSDLMKNKRNKIVSKKQNAHGKKAFKFISSWTSAVISARKELGIKGFCAINGLQRSTSSWCSRVSDSFEFDAQTDQRSVQGASCSLGEADLVCHLHNRLHDKVAESMTDLALKGTQAAEQVLDREQHVSAEELNYGGVCRMTQLDCGRCRLTAQADDCMGSCGACSMSSLDSMGSCGACSMTSLDSMGPCGACSMTSLDSMGSCIGVLGKSGWGAATTSNFNYNMEKKEENVAVETRTRRVWIGKQKKSEASALGITSHGIAGCDQQADELEDAVKQDGEACFGLDAGPKANHEEDMCKFLAVGTEIVWNEAKKMDAKQLFGENWKRFMQQQIFVLDFAFQVFYREREDTGDLGLNRDKFIAFVFETMVERISVEVQMRLFIQQQGLPDVKEAVEEKKGAAQPDCASGSTEDVPRDTGKVATAANGERSNAADANERLCCGEEEHDYLTYDEVQFRDVEEVPEAFAAFGCMEDFEDWTINKRFKRGKVAKTKSFYVADGQYSQQRSCQMIGGLSATGAAASLRGGANKFAPLAVEEDETEDHVFDQLSSCIEDELGEEQKETLSEEDHEEEGELNCSIDSNESGRSYYAEFYERKAALRGGAGGASSNATKNKQITNALDALAAVCKSMEPSQDEDATEGVVKQISQLAKQWQEKTPTKGEMRTQLRRLHVLLEQDCQRMADPEASREANAENTQQSKQSFYGDFVQRLRGQEAKPDGEWKTKGKGKGSKGKNQQKGKKSETLPRFDLMKIWPSRAISTWQVLQKELESGREPSGSVVIVENAEKMAEYQSLAAAHALVNNVIMVTRAGEEEPTNVKNHQVLWLPYLSNLALAKAVVATTTGAAADVKGVEPIKKEKNGPIAEKQTTLRIIVDLWLIDGDKKREGLKQHPHAALHGVAKGKIQELKTHGWSVGEHTISGYCTVE